MIDDDFADRTTRRCTDDDVRRLQKALPELALYYPEIVEAIKDVFARLKAAERYIHDRKNGYCESQLTKTFMLWLRACGK